MKTFRTIMAATIALGMASPAIAQQSGQSQQQQDRQQQRDRQHQVSMEKVRKNVEGKVLDVRTIRLRGESEPHVLAKVRRNDGRIVVLDLGPVNSLRDKNVRLFKGSDLRAAGQTGSINGRPILIVDRMLADDRFTVLIPMNQREARAMRDQQRRRQLDRQRGGMQQARYQQQRDRWQRGQDPRTTRREMQRTRAPRSAVGELVEIRKANLRGLGDHHLAKIRTQRGNSVIIDLGSQSLDELNLSKGETIAVSGVPGRVNGKPVLFADRIADMMRVDRREEQRRQQQQQRRQGGQQGQN